MRLGWIGLSLLCACQSKPAMPALPSGCDSAVYHRLDFWLGSWDVTDLQGHYEGTNVVARALHGCAVEERWTDARGHRGNGLFYVDRATGAWRQVWLTDDGPMKEKREEPTPSGIRFAGEIATAGGIVVDRTTLTPMDGDRVRQRIEQSRDHGSTWETWDGIYARIPSACTSLHHHQFDFWLGDWKVDIHSRKSQTSEEWVESLGSNRVTTSMNGCVIEEQFLGAGGGSPTWSGRSWSMWIPAREVWRQTWVDDSGAYLAFTGGMEAGQMKLTGEPSPDGKTMRMVFADITRDHISWRWEATRDGGATWRAMMRIEYHRL